MRISGHLARVRQWLPGSVNGIGFHPIRWVLLDGNRYAVSGLLLLLVFSTFLVVGTLWTFGVQQLLTETTAVQSLLDTILNGIILLVSIVVSTNAIVLSYDITSVSSQEERIQASMDLRRRIGDVAEQDESPADPASFLEVMAEVIETRAREVERATEGGNEEIAHAIAEYVESITETIDRIDRTVPAEQGGFAVLWQGLELDYGTFMDQSNKLRHTYRDNLDDDTQERLDDLVEALELFATGKEYFKTLYYAREISALSRSLLAVSLPTILLTATTILAINARVLPDVWVLGLPPLLSFVAATFTLSLTPFVVLTAYMLRVATVAHETVAAGPFVLKETS